MEKKTQIFSNKNGHSSELVNIQLSENIGDFVVQFDVQNESLSSMESESLCSQKCNNINCNSHADITQTILKQVKNPVQASSFLNILQHLLRIDSNHTSGNIIWNTIEKLVHRAILIDNPDDAERILNDAIEPMTMTCLNCNRDENSNMLLIEPIKSEQTREERPETEFVSKINCTPSMPNATPPPTSSQTYTPGMAPPPTVPGIPPPVMTTIPPPPPIMTGIPPLPTMTGTPSHSKLAQQSIPRPVKKMKTLNWDKIPPFKILGKQNIWTIMSTRQPKSIDFKELEDLFCVQAPKADTVITTDTIDGKLKTIHLIDGKRSLNINIFLKQFKGYDTNDAVIDLIASGNHNIVGSERLRGLLRLLPDAEEKECLNNFHGDHRRLGSAERFLLLLLQIPNYELRIESMLLKEEFKASITYLEPLIKATIEAGNKLMNNQTIVDIVHIVVTTGNFLNYGGYAGNAVGVKISCLTQLTDIRATKPGVNFMHFLTTQIKKFKPSMLQLMDDLKFLENVSKINIEQISSDIKSLDMQLQKIATKITGPNIANDIKNQMQDFLQNAKKKIINLNLLMEEVDIVRLKVADFFCEDISKFRLDECFKIFHSFYENFLMCNRENEKRNEMERKNILRQNAREAQTKIKSNLKYSNRSPTSKNKCLRHSRNHSTNVIRIEVSRKMSCGVETNNSSMNGDEFIDYLVTNPNNVIFLVISENSYIPKWHIKATIGVDYKRKLL
ncbi:FH2 domain-containing protein 1-like [Haematobia irritans]|uniref:FH2 domain-containing protein 1-like n=1 Tax=Haematobia irritans TaxID=7368 RepID=UPI003F50120D